MSLFDPESWAQVLDKLPSQFPAVVGSMFIALLRILFDQEETKVIRIALEMLLCGALTYLAWVAIKTLGLNLEWAVVAGGCIGYLGPVTVRSIALAWFKSKIKGAK